MTKGRLEAFSDGVIAIIITIMVLELKVPTAGTLAALKPTLPTLSAYVLSFVYVGIYWNNHHHMMHVTPHVNGQILWANLHLLFWMSLIPFVSAWTGQAFDSVSVAAYGIILFLTANAWGLMVRAIVKLQGKTGPLATALGKNMKGRISAWLYAAAIPLAFVHPAISATLYVVVATLWVVPDMRIERRVPKE
jgi:uncharacterized membrane protein